MPKAPATTDEIYCTLRIRVRNQKDLTELAQILKQPNIGIVKKETENKKRVFYPVVPTSGGLFG